MLLRHPVELARMREDLASGSEEYLGAAIDEALRLRTPLFGLGRGAVVDYRLGRFTIPRGIGHRGAAAAGLSLAGALQ